MQDVVDSTKFSSSLKLLRRGKVDLEKINLKYYWSRFYYPINILKKTCFIFIIVYLQNYIHAQLFSLVSLSLFYLLYLMIFQPLTF